MEDSPYVTKDGNDPRLFRELLVPAEWRSRCEKCNRRTRLGLPMRIRLGLLYPLHADHPALHDAMVEIDPRKFYPALVCEHGVNHRQVQ